MSNLELFLNLSMVIISLVAVMTYLFIGLVAFEKDNSEVKIGSREANAIQAAKYAEAVAAVKPATGVKLVLKTLSDFYYKII